MTDSSSDDEGRGEMGKSERQIPAVTQPDKADPKWQEKVEKAKQAREMGRSMRQGKQKSFRHAVGRTK